MLLENKNIVITGAGRGIGKAIAMACAKEGANIGITSRSMDELNAVKEEIEAMGAKGKVVIKTADITVYEEVEAMLKYFHAELGSLNGIIANAGASGRWDTHEFSPEKFATIINVNITGVFHAFKASYPYLKKDDKKDKARFIITGSAAYPAAMPKFAAYTASKYGVVGFQNALALEYKKENITINTILPTMVDTKLLRGDKAGDGNKPDNVMNPEDLIDYYVFLLSEDGNRVSGELIYTNEFEQLKGILGEIPEDKKTNWDALKEYLETNQPAIYENVRKNRRLVEYLLKKA